MITYTSSLNTDSFCFIYSELHARFSSLPFVTNFKYFVSERLGESRFQWHTVHADLVRFRAVQTCIYSLNRT